MDDTSSSTRMKKRLWFKNPPILEAVIALNVSQLPATVLSAFADLANPMKDLGYSQSEPVWQHNFAFAFEKGGAESSTNDHVFQLGLKFKSDDGLYAVQLNLTGIIFSRLGKYETWDGFRDEGRKLWNLFALSTGQPQVASIGVRYINKLFIPLNEGAEEYITVWPHLPDGIVQRIEALQMRISLPIVEPSGTLVHTQISLPPEKEGFAALLFDNDFQFITANLSSDEVWEMLESVRDVKDEYFERFTTEKMRMTFDA